MSMLDKHYNFNCDPVACVVECSVFVWNLADIKLVVALVAVDRESIRDCFFQSLIL